MKHHQLFHQVYLHHIGAMPLLNWHAGKTYEDISFLNVSIRFQYFRNIRDGLVSGCLLIVIISTSSPYKIHGIKDGFIAREDEDISIRSVG